MFMKQLAFYIFTIITVQCYCQTYPYKQFTTSDGLINNRCGNVAQDSLGYIWITSDDGICNYDGRKFNFFAGQKSTYYFAHTNTINMYKGQCTFATFNEGFATGIGNNLIFHKSIAYDDKEIVYGLFIRDSSTLVAKIYATDLELINGNKKTILHPPLEIAKKMKTFLMFHKDVAGNIWIGTDAGVYVYQKQDFANPIIIPAFYNQYCDVLKSDHQGNVFFAIEKKVFKINVNELNNIKQVQPILFANHAEYITAMGFNKQGDILVSNLPNGLNIYTKDLVLKKSISKHGLPDVVFWDIFIDREENIWLATENGVYRFANFDFINYIPFEATGSPNIRSGAALKKDFLFSNGISIYKLKNNIPQIITPPHKELNIGLEVIANANDFTLVNFMKSGTLIPETWVTEIVKDKLIKKKYLFGPSQKISTIEKKRFVLMNDKQFLFANNDNDLYLFQNNTATPIVLPSSVANLKITLLAKGNQMNTFFIVDKTTAIYYCNLVSENNKTTIKIIQKIFCDSLKKVETITKVFFDKKNKLWLGTNKGIQLYLANAQKNYYHYKTILEPTISDNRVNELIQDSNDAIWVGTNKGVDKITIQPNIEIKIQKGLFNNLMSGRLVYFINELDRKLYIGTTGALSVVNIDSKLSPIAPCVYINHILVNNKNADSLLKGKSPIFSATDNNITFEFVATTFINEQLTEYQYQLVGVDEVWSKLSTNYVITYNQLAAGKYIFKVRAKNASGSWTENDASFNFEIKKHFYNHWLFYFMCAALLFGLGYWLYKLKINRFLAVERTRNSISKDLHDDIGTTLSSVTLMNAVLKTKIEKQPDEAKLMVAKIEDTCRDLIQNLNDIVWSINPKNDTMEKLMYRLQQFCNDTFLDQDMIIDLSFSNEIKTKSLSMQLRRDIYLVCKEIISNAAKYSKAKFFRLRLQLSQNNNIEIIAEDNGIGFNEEIAKKGNGLTNIRQRIITNKGICKLTSQKGTFWNITIPT